MAVSQPWYEMREGESIDETRSRRLMSCPALSPAELDVLRQLAKATWDGNLASKSARSQLIRKGLAVAFNGWQIASREGLAVLETLGYLKA